MKMVVYHREEPERGLGDINRVAMSGTNTAVLQVAKAIGSMGHEVILLSEIGEISEQKDVDVVLVSRNPVVAMEYAKWAERVFLWCHDHPFQLAYIAFEDEEFEKDFARSGVKVVCVSDFLAKELIGRWKVFDGKLMVVRNGVDLSLYDGREKRRNDCVYASAPGRGLELLLEMWPRVVDKVPGARLRVFSSMSMYGQCDDEKWKREVGNMEDMGVIWQEPLDQRSLAKVLCGSKLMLYPTNVEETSCLSVLEAVAAGCVVVTSDVGAMGESAVGNVLLREEYSSFEYRSRFVAETVDLLGNDLRWGEMSRRNVKRGRRGGWMRVAREMLEVMS